MLSKEMYTVLSCFERKLGHFITYENLLDCCALDENDIIECLYETTFGTWNYVRSSDGFKPGSKLYLTETGLAKIEEYEDGLRNQRFARITLIVSVIALFVSVVALFK